MRTSVAIREPQSSSTKPKGTGQGEGTESRTNLSKTTSELLGTCDNSTEGNRQSAKATAEELGGSTPPCAIPTRHFSQKVTHNHSVLSEKKSRQFFSAGSIIHSCESFSPALLLSSYLDSSKSHSHRFIETLI